MGQTCKHLKLPVDTTYCFPFSSHSQDLAMHNFMSVCKTLDVDDLVIINITIHAIHSVLTFFPPCHCSQAISSCWSNHILWYNQKFSDTYMASIRRRWRWLYHRLCHWTAGRMAVLMDACYSDLPWHHQLLCAEPQRGTGVCVQGVSWKLSRQVSAIGIRFGETQTSIWWVNLVFRLFILWWFCFLSVGSQIVSTQASVKQHWFATFSVGWLDG